MSPSSSEPFLACVAFTLVSWCLSYHALHLVFIARVACNLFSWRTTFMMYHLQVVFMACVALRLAAFLALDVFRLVFITCFALIFLFSSRVSLLGFLSLYSAYSFQAGLFMVFSASNLVFVVCVIFSLVFGIFCSYLFSVSFLPVGSFFRVYCFFCPPVRRLILVLHFTFSIPYSRKLTLHEFKVLEINAT